MSQSLTDVYNLKPTAKVYYVKRSQLEDILTDMVDKITGLSVPTTVYLDCAPGSVGTIGVHFEDWIHDVSLSAVGSFTMDLKLSNYGDWFTTAEELLCQLFNAKKVMATHRAFIDTEDANIKIEVVLPKEA